MESINQNEIRNVMLPLAVARPNLYKKLGYSALIVFYLMAVISFLSDGFLTNYIYLEMGLIIVLLLVVSNIYEYFYRSTYEELVDENQTGVVIGFSNKLLILAGDTVIDYYETDEIQIRQVRTEEEDTFFGKHTSIIECFKDGEVIGRIGIGKFKEFEGVTLTADMSRADEDIEIVFDEDEEGESEEDSDLDE